MRSAIVSCGKERSGKKRRARGGECFNTQVTDCRRAKKGASKFWEVPLNYSKQRRKSRPKKPLLCPRKGDLLFALKLGLISFALVSWGRGWSGRLISRLIPWPVHSVAVFFSSGSCIATRARESTLNTTSRNLENDGRIVFVACYPVPLSTATPYGLPRYLTWPLPLLLSSRGSLIVLKRDATANFYLPTALPRW